MTKKSGSGGIGRHTILRGWRSQGVGVQVPPPAQRIVGQAFVLSFYFGKPGFLYTILLNPIYWVNSPQANRTAGRGWSASGVGVSRQGGISQTQQVRPPAQKSKADLSPLFI